jgi:hypothetical protein
MFPGDIVSPKRRILWRGRDVSIPISGGDLEIGSDRYAYLSQLSAYYFLWDEQYLPLPDVYFLHFVPALVFAAHRTLLLFFLVAFFFGFALFLAGFFLFAFFFAMFLTLKFLLCNSYQTISIKTFGEKFAFFNS